MSFLNRFRSAQKDGAIKDWKILDTESQLDQVIKDSYNKPVVLFKHSVTCGISAGAKHTLESNWDFKEEELDFYYLDLLSFRSVSNKIAELFDVIHQSPQVILIKDGKAVYNTSHHKISVPGLRSAL